MLPEQRRLRRLQRLEQVRAIAKQAAAQEAALAEGTLAQLQALATRTRLMADDYRAHAGPSDGHTLRQHSLFVSGLGGISAVTSRDAAQAQTVADRKQDELALAERRRAAVEERALASERRLAQQVAVQSLGARRAVGTGLE